MKFLLWLKTIYNAKWGNKWSAIINSGFWIITDYITSEELPRYFNHKHEYYNSAAGSGTVMECSHCGIHK